MTTTRLEEAKAAYAIGLENGYGIGAENCHEFADGDSYMEACLEHESDAFRQLSPFEFYAHDFNNSEDPEYVWMAYERGVERGLLRAWAEYKRKQRASKGEA